MKNLDNVLHQISDTFCTASSFKFTLSLAAGAFICHQNPGSNVKENEPKLQAVEINLVHQEIIQNSLFKKMLEYQSVMTLNSCVPVR
jgi:hypothetical protein